MKLKLCFISILFVSVLLCSCESPKIENDEQVLEYDVIEIDSCEYIMVQSETYFWKKVTSIAHKGNCKYCQERRKHEFDK